MIADTGPIRFDAFMDEALYGPAGFYTSGRGSAGRGGDFLTSVEVGPLFGAVVARFLDAEWERIGRPDPYTVVDAGAGPGTLARSVLAARPACAGSMRYVAVELSEAQRGRHPPEIESVERLDRSGIDGVVFASELLDNLPFRLAVFDGGWREAHVERRAGRWIETLSAAIEPLPDVLPAEAPHGARAPLHDAASRWVDDALGRLRSGTVVAIDYFAASTAELARRPWREWLRTYRGHGRGGHYLTDPGHQDITTEVALDQLLPPDSIRPQAEWLRIHSIDQLVAEGRRHWEQHAAQPDLAAIRMRSRIGEAEALLDEAGLGGFTVCEWRARP